MAGGSYGSSGDSFSPTANINVTPLVDVMLVLLVIFMVTAPMLQQGVEVNLPKATTAPLSGSTEQVVLSIDREGKIFLGSGNQIALEQLADKIKALMEQRPPEQQRIFIKGDTDIAYGMVMKVMGRLHAAGFSEIGLVSAPPEGE